MLDIIDDFIYFYSLSENRRVCYIYRFLGLTICILWLFQTTRKWCLYPWLNAHTIKNSPFLYPMSVTMFQEEYLPYIYIWNSLHPFAFRDVSLILERKGKNIVFGLLLSSFQFPSPYVLQYFAANTVSALQIM